MLSVDAFLRAQMRLAAGLRPDPLEELQRSPRPHSRNPGRGPTCKGKGMRKERVGDERGDEGISSALFNSWLPPCIAATFPTLLALYAGV